MKSALDIIRASNRPDIFIKFKYAQSKLTLGYVPKSIELMYLESIRSFNNFNEFYPKKIGPSDFIKHFDDLITSIQVKGLMKGISNEKIQIDPSGEVHQGAHRVAILAALKQDISDYEISEDKSDFNFEYFKMNGIQEYVLRFALLIKSELNFSTTCFLIHAVVNPILDDQIKNCIQERTSIVYQTSCKFTLDQILYLKFINYRINPNVETWIGNKKNNFSPLRNHAIYSNGNFSTRLIVMPKMEEKDSINLKNDIRELVGRGNFSVHSTESNEEARHLIEILCHPSTRELFIQKRINTDPTFISNTQDISKFEDLKFRELVRNGIIGGSYVLELYNLRKSRDVDIFVRKERDNNYESVFDLKHNIEVSDFEQEHPNKSFDEIILDPLKHIKLFGLTFLSLEELRKWKEERKEYPKDFRDLELIKESGILGIRKKESKLPKLEKFFWQYRAFCSRITLQLARKLYSYRASRFIGKKLKSFIRKMRN